MYLTRSHTDIDKGSDVFLPHIVLGLECLAMKHKPLSRFHFYFLQETHLSFVFCCKPSIVIKPLSAAS